MTAPGEAPSASSGTRLLEASSPEKIREHAERSGLPADEVIPVGDTVIMRPDPAPAEAA